MRIVLELENSSRLHFLLEFLKDLKYVKTIKILETDSKEESELSNLSQKDALDIILAGCEMTSFGNPLEFQNQQRSDRQLPFTNS